MKPVTDPVAYHPRYPETRDKPPSVTFDRISRMPLLGVFRTVRLSLGSGITSCVYTAFAGPRPTSPRVLHPDLTDYGHYGFPDQIGWDD